MNEGGADVGEMDDYIWLVRDAVIGDVARAKAIKIKRSCGFARLMEVLKLLASRVIPLCPVARQCGDYQLQVMSYEGQLKFRERKVMNNLIRIGEFVKNEIHMLPIMRVEKPWRYRSKAQFLFGKNKGGGIVAGFYAGWTHAIVGAEDYLLGVEGNREVLDIVKQFMREIKIEPYDEISHKGLVRHILVRKGFRTGKIMVYLVINDKKLPGGEHLVEMLTGGDGKDGKGQGIDEQGTKGLEVEKQDTSENETEGYISNRHVNRCGIKGTASVFCSVNQGRANMIMGKEIVNLYDPGFITDYIGNVKYQIPPFSFYQVNSVQTERFYGTALEYVGFTGNETVQDLYCGIGTTSLLPTQRAKKICGVEIIPQAIGDTRRGTETNSIDNTEFLMGEIEGVLSEQFEENHIHADMIVVDPPKKGCDAICLDIILKVRPERMVYAGYDSATLAGDLRYLADGGCVVERGRYRDIFSGVAHVKVAIKVTYCGNKKK